MRFYIVEEDKLRKPLYKSNFPLYQKMRGSSDVSSKWIKQFLFRKSIALYVDDVYSYRAMGGKEGTTEIKQFRASDYPTWRTLTGIISYDIPHFTIKDTIKSGLFPQCEIIRDVLDDNGIITIKAEPLIKADSKESLTCVHTVYYDYIKSWKQSISSESASVEEEKAKKWFSNKLKNNNLATYKDAESWIIDLLNPNDEDSGIVRKAKCCDFCRLQEYVKSRYGMCSLIVLSGGNHIYDKYDVYRAAQLLYHYERDYGFYGPFDDDTVEGIAHNLHQLAQEASFLSSGISNKTIDLNWAHLRMKELQSEWNESGFPVNERGDTSNAWEQFNSAITYIKNAIKLN